MKTLTGMVNQTEGELTEMPMKNDPIEEGFQLEAS